MLKGHKDRIFVNEQLTKKRNELYFETRKLVKKGKIKQTWGPFHKGSYERFLFYEFVEPVLNYRSNEFVALTNLCETGPWTHDGRILIRNNDDKIQPMKSMSDITPFNQAMAGWTPTNPDQ